MTTYREIPLNNWTGEKMDVVVENGSFEMYDYTFTMANITEHFADTPNLTMTSFDLEGDDWEDALHTLYIDGPVNEERMIRLAVTWIANHV